MRILLISPHADDVEIGMGGTVCKLVDEGHEVKLVVAIIPCERPDGSIDSVFKKQRIGEQEVIAKKLGVDLEVLDMSPYDFKFSREYTKIFDKIVRDYKPSRIFSCWNYDTHQDHIAMSRIIEVASRKNDASLYLYETMMPGGIGLASFNPQYFVDISDFSDSKEEVLKIYDSVFSENPHYIDSIMARSRFRGGQIGVKHAEAFEIVKQIEY